MASAIPAATSLHFQRADANDDDYVAAAAPSERFEQFAAEGIADPAAPAWSPPVRDVEALMQQFDDDPVQLVIRLLTLAHQVQEIANGLQSLDRAVSERLEGGARGPSLEQMRDSLSGLLSREIL